MPTIGYYFSSCPDTEYMPDIMVEISNAEFIRREQAPLIRREETGRTARKEISLYDAMLAEIYAEHDGEKARVRNRRRADRKHPENKAERMRKMHNRLERKYGYYSCDGGLVHRGYINGELYADGKTRVSESVARADWELEQLDIEDARLDAELEAEYRAWEARYNHEKYMRKLNEWLKYA